MAIATGIGAALTAMSDWLGLAIGEVLSALRSWADELRGSVVAHDALSEVAL